MTRRHLFVMDPLASVNPSKDTTFAFIEETQARGHENLVCGVGDLRTDGKRPLARAQPVTVERGGQPHFRAGDVVDVCLDDVDIVWMRKDPPVDDNYLFATMILDLTSALVLNRPSSLRVAHEKMWALFADDLTPKSVVSARPADLVEAIRAWGCGVLKPLHLMGGLGVMVFEAGDKNLRSAADLLTAEGRRHAIAQEYLPAVREGDKRVILVDGAPLGAVLRVPRDDDVRSNMHVGGSARRADVDDDDRNIAARIGPRLRELGLFFVGIDVIGGKLTEVNVTSPTGVQEIDRLDGRAGADRLVARVIDAAVAKLP
jgi:glutathione synthase